jgi:hypothetical protein
MTVDPTLPSFFATILLYKDEQLWIYSEQSGALNAAVMGV